MTPLCRSCKHFGEGPGCAAFPDAIPDGILSGEIDHTKPVDGDNGIQYEEREID